MGGDGSERSRPFSLPREDTECKAAAYLAPKGDRGQEHAVSKAGWTKYLPSRSVSQSPYG